MSEFLRILVVGATGAQSGSVARHLLRDGRYQVRCLTRRSTSAAAREIAGLGGELVEGDLRNPAVLRAALRGCDGIFGVTNYWEHFEGEFEQGRNLVDARGATLPATYVHPACYYENFLNHFPPRRQADGTYVFGFQQGTTPLAAVSVEDLGGVVAAIFAESFWYRDKVVGVVGDDLDFPGARELADMFEFNRLYVPNRRVDLAKSRGLFPGIRSFERWLRAHLPAFEQALAN